MRPATLRLARICGFRYDQARDAHVLRVVGKRYGPVLRNRPPVDSVAEQMEWAQSLDELGARRKSGRFARDPQDAESTPPDVLPG